MTTSASSCQTRPEHRKKPQRPIFGSGMPLTAAAVCWPAMTPPCGTIPFEIRNLPLNIDPSLTTDTTPHLDTAILKDCRA